MRINHNIGAMISHWAHHSQEVSLKKSIEKLSSGLSINRASDDAAGLSVSEGMRNQVRSMNQANRNAGDGIALLQIAEGSTGQIGDILQRMRELAIQSATDTLTSIERNYTDQEFQQLMSEIDRISRSTQYNGMTLIDGGPDSFGVAGGLSSILHVGAGSSSQWDRFSITVNAMTLGALGLALATTSVSTSTGAVASLSSIDSALKSVNTARSDLGAYVNRLEFSMAILTNMTINTQDAESRIRDADFAKETMNFTRSQLLHQSATSMLAQANQTTQGALALLQG